MALILFCIACSRPVAEVSNPADTALQQVEETDKLSAILRQQVDARLQQLQAPSEQNLQRMRELGMTIDTIEIQRVYIYLKEQLTAEQEKDLASLGVKAHEDSWIPPMSNHPYGFLIAGVPADKVTELAARDYVIKLDTAERQALSPCEIIPR